MAWWETLKWLIGVIVVALCGALIKMVFDRLAKRHQPVQYRLEIDNVFKSVPALQALAMTPDGEMFNDLTLLRLIITNRGSENLRTFAFKFALPSTSECIAVDCENVDESHRLIVESPPSTTEPSTVLEFKCEPFNRGDEYVAKLYVAANIIAADASKLKPTSAEPVRFVAAGRRDESTVSRTAILVIFIGTIFVGISFNIWLVFLGVRLSHTESTQDELGKRLTLLDGRAETLRAINDKLKQEVDKQTKEISVLEAIKLKHPEWVEEAKRK